MIFHGPVEIIDLPSRKNGGSFHSYGTVYQRGTSFIYLDKLQRPHCSPSLEIMVRKGNYPLLWPQEG